MFPPLLITEIFASVWPVTVWLSVQTQFARQRGPSCAHAHAPLFAEAYYCTRITLPDIFVWSKVLKIAAGNNRRRLSVKKIFHQETKLNLFELCVCIVNGSQLCISTRLRKLRKLSRRESVFLLYFRPPFWVWLWVWIEMLLHFLQNLSNDNHFCI